MAITYPLTITQLEDCSGLGFSGIDVDWEDTGSIIIPNGYNYTKIQRVDVQVSKCNNDSSASTIYTVLEIPRDIEFTVTTCQPCYDSNFNYERIEIIGGNLTNVISKRWEVIRSGFVILSEQGDVLNTCDIETFGVDQPLGPGDEIVLILTLRNGNEIRYTKVLDTVDADLCSYTWEEGDFSVDPANIDIGDSKSLVSKDGTFEFSSSGLEGVYNITINVYYEIDNTSGILVESGCQLLDCSLKCKIACFNIKNLDYNKTTRMKEFEKALEIMALYESLSLAVQCDLCAAACEIWDVLIKLLSQHDCRC